MDFTLQGYMNSEAARHAKLRAQRALLRGEPVNTSAAADYGQSPPDPAGGASGSWDAPPQPPAQAPARPQALVKTLGSTLGTTQGPVGPVSVPAAQPIADPLLEKQADLEKQLQEALNPPDRTAMEQAYQKRAAQGGIEDALAMMAGEAKMQPFQAQHLKQAAAARAPMQMAGGTMTEQGFIEDPGYAREHKLKQIMSQIAQNDRIIQSNATAAEKRAAEARTHALQLQIAAGHNATMVALKQAGGGEKAAAADARNEDQLSRQFDTQVKNYVGELDATSKLGTIAPGRRPNAIEQQSMIILLNRFLDPTSVVREGEFNRVATAQGLVQRAQNLYNRVAAGEPMSDQLVNDVRAMAKLYEQAASGKIRQVGDLYSEKARRRGLNPENVVVNPYYQHGGTTPPGTPPTQAVGTTPRVTSDADYNALPPNTLFVGPDGKTRRKP